MIKLSGEKIIWKINSSLHDWRDGVLVNQFVEQANILGLIDQATWIKTYADDKPRSLNVNCLSDLYSYLLGVISSSQEEADFEIGGANWALYINIYPYNKELERVDGINTIWLRFDRSTIQGSKGTEALMEAFFDLHKPNNTEYAVINPYQHWFDISAAQYETPITIAPMFQGVFWMNFLGGDQLQEFDLDKLNALTCYRKQWLDRSGLFFVTASDLLEGNEYDLEHELLRLSEFFRDALKEHPDYE